MSESRPARPSGSTGRAFVNAIILGFANVFEDEERSEPAIVEQRIGGDGDPIDLILDPDDPRLTVAFVRPWLRKRT